MSIPKIKKEQQREMKKREIERSSILIDLDKLHPERYEILPSS
jgi:hypothetical protein